MKKIIQDIEGDDESGITSMAIVMLKATMIIMMIIVVISILFIYILSHLQL